MSATRFSRGLKQVIYYYHVNIVQPPPCCQVSRPISSSLGFINTSEAACDCHNEYDQTIDVYHMKLYSNFMQAISSSCSFMLTSNIKQVLPQQCDSEQVIITKFLQILSGLLCGKLQCQDGKIPLTSPNPPKMSPSLCYFSMGTWSTSFFSINMCYFIIHVVNPSSSVKHVSYLSNHVVDSFPEFLSFR